MFLTYKHTEISNRWFLRKRCVWCMRKYGQAEARLLDISLLLAEGLGATGIRGMGVLA